MIRSRVDHEPRERMRAVVGRMRRWVALSSPRVRALTMLGMVLGVVFSTTACIQQSTVYDPFTIVNVQVDVPLEQTRAGIRVSVSGSRRTGNSQSGAGTSGDNDSSFTDSTGFATIRTQVTGPRFIVARHQDYDIAYGGDKANVELKGPRAVFERGRIVFPELGTAVIEPDYFYPFVGALSDPDIPDPNLTSPQKVGMRPKIPGKARFVFILEDSNILIQTLDPAHKPQAIGKVFVTGSFNNFNLNTEDVDPDGAREMFDGQSSAFPEAGDDRLGDGVFTRVLDLPAGEHTYAFLVNSIGVLVRDPYEENSETVRIVNRTPDSVPGNPNQLELREVRVSKILVK